MNDESNFNPEDDIRNDLVSVGCSVCGDLFRMSRRIPMMHGNDERGFGVSVSRELGPINPTKLHPTRKDANVDNVMNRFVKKNMEPVTMFMSWDIHADNVDICPDCAYAILIAKMKDEKDRYKDYKLEGLKMSNRMVSPIIDDIE